MLPDIFILACIAQKKGWTFREWAPNATEIYLIGDFNGWQEQAKYKLKRVKNTGNWEINLRENAIKHGDLYKLKVYWEGGCGERIPAWATRVVQETRLKFSVHRSGILINLTNSRKKFSYRMCHL